MNTVHCYRLLGLTSTAGLEELKASYRRLARQYHPDINQGNQQAERHFIRLTEAYQFLKEVLPPTPTSSKPEVTQGGEVSASSAHAQKSSWKQVYVPALSVKDQALKWEFYEKLQAVIKEKRFARAIALVEGLSYRLPLDPEIRQWKAIIYQYRGRQLLQEKQIKQAKSYFQKALRTDPYNRLLEAEIQQALNQV